VSFEYPYVFLLLLLFVLIDKFYPLKEKAIIIPHISQLMPRYSRFNIGYFSKWIFLISFIIALASPYKSDSIIEQENRGYNIGLVLDASLSMRGLGFDYNNITLNKFDIVKNIVGEFIKKRTSDNLSIVVFGSFSFVALPLTFDKSMSISVLKTLQIGMAGKSTAINDGLAQSIKTLMSTKAKKNIAILLTDGKNTSGEIPINVVVKLAKKYNIKVYSIGIGRDGDFDTSFLEYISNQTGGKFFASSNKNGLQKIYQEIDKLEKQKLKSSTYTYKIYYFHYPLIVALIAFFIYLITQMRKSIK